MLATSRKGISIALHQFLIKYDLGSEAAIKFVASRIHGFVINMSQTVFKLGQVSQTAHRFNMRQFHAQTHRVSRDQKNRLLAPKRQDTEDHITGRFG
jgi:hypothetical protein